MRLFDNYLNELDGVLSKKTKVSSSGLIEQRYFDQNITKAFNSASINEINRSSVPSIIEGPKVMLKYDKSALIKYFGVNSHEFDNITIGPHPDFSDLDTLSYLNHHCVSVFVDIKGSTRLIEKYSLLEVRFIKDSLLTLAIKVANQFGGHVHRLQGDGIFLQFVRRGLSKNDAIINALNATSILTHFVLTDLATIMNNYQIRPLKIRVGVDFGDDNQVLWSHYGIPGCGELTTTSLHTDMAAKLQAKAYDNSILIGDNIKKTLDLKSDFYSIFENETNKEKVFYISHQFTYPFFVFNWQEYLLSLPFFSKASNGTNLEIREKPFSIECYISDQDGSNMERYFPNSKSIPKLKKIDYFLKHGNLPYNKTSSEKIEWKAYNSGEQAKKANDLIHDFAKLNHDKNFCIAHAGYLGHHFVECKIIREREDNVRITFPIFVQ